MGTYRVEWPCCGSATETQAWEPERCPFCEPDNAPTDPALLALAKFGAAMLGAAMTNLTGGPNGLFYVAADQSGVAARAYGLWDGEWLLAPGIAAAIARLLTPADGDA